MLGLDVQRQCNKYIFDNVSAIEVAQLRHSEADALAERFARLAGAAPTG